MPERLTNEESGYRWRLLQAVRIETGVDLATAERVWELAGMPFIEERRVLRQSLWNMGRDADRLACELIKDRGADALWNLSQTPS